MPGRFRVRVHADPTHAVPGSGRDRRQRLHQRVGEILEAMHGDADAQVPEPRTTGSRRRDRPDTRNAPFTTPPAGDLAVAALAGRTPPHTGTGRPSTSSTAAPAGQSRPGALLVGLGRAQILGGDADALATLLDAPRPRSANRHVRSARRGHGRVGRGSFSQLVAEDAELTTSRSPRSRRWARLIRRPVRLLATLMEHARGGNWREARSTRMAAVESARRLGDDRLLMEAITFTYAGGRSPTRCRNAWRTPHARSRSRTRSATRWSVAAAASHAMMPSSSPAGGRRGRSAGGGDGRDRPGGRHHDPLRPLPNSSKHSPATAFSPGTTPRSSKRSASSSRSPRRTASNARAAGGRWRVADGNARVRAGPFARDGRRRPRRRRAIPGTSDRPRAHTRSCSRRRSSRRGPRAVRRRAGIGFPATSRTTSISQPP